MKPTLTVDRAATRKRIARLRATMEQHVLTADGAFCCDKFAECKRSIQPGHRFHEGQLSHVGHHYDLRRNGQCLRILVVGQECGLHSPGGAAGAHRCVSLDERYQMIHDGSGLALRYYADRKHGLRGRNPHMRGTTSALRLILGRGLGADWPGEFIECGRTRCHVFDAFALVNVLLCAAGPKGSSRGASSRVMRENCLRHFAATLDILAPTLVILQGHGVRKWTAGVIGDGARITPHLVEAQVAGKRALVCEFSHPSARGALAWGNRLDGEYLTSVVEPTLGRALRLL